MKPKTITKLYAKGRGKKERDCKVIERKEAIIISVFDRENESNDHQQRET